ncbi:MAG: DMT family transporter [Limnobacter sp.]|nr:DMT family transporter [Limnobacter sp.]
MLSRSLPYLALILNALVWGTSWWPLREMQSDGLHPLWASAGTYLLGSVVIIALQPGVLKEFITHRPLWLLALAAGATMCGFNWGVTIAEVIRVVLLFYLMPIWALLFARFILNEPLSWQSVGRVVMALVGAILVLSPEGEIGLPRPSNLGEWLGLFGGACFALNNVMLRHQQARSEQARLFAMFVGGIFIPVLLALFLDSIGSNLVPLPTGISGYGLVVLLVFSGLLVAANYGLQYGAARLSASVTAVVMLSEVVFATLSAILLTEETLTWQTGGGGALILAAAALSALDPRAP